MSAALSWESASIGYGQTPVVSDVDLEARYSEVLGIIGPNGAGKSTLIKAIWGDAAVLSGRVVLDGRDVTETTARERALTVAVVPQRVEPAFLFTAREFVGMGRHARRSRFTGESAADAKAVERAMERTDTTHLADRFVDELSGGELQRLAMAQALAQEPRILVLDEPTNHLDLNHRMEVLDLAHELASQGLAVVSVFHDLDMAARYSHRIAVVANGSVRAASEPRSVLTAELVRSVFGVRAVVEPDPVTGAVSVTPILRDAAVEVASPGSVLVVGGSGVAAPLVRRLTVEGWHVRAAALNEGDTDAVVCAALGLPYVSVPPFAPMSAAHAEAVAAAAATVDEVVVCDVPFGHGNLENLRRAVEPARSVTLVGAIEGRDYCDGEATRIWNDAVSRGARTVDHADDVLRAATADGGA